MAGAASAMAEVPRHSWRVWWQLVRDAIGSWIDDYAPSMGAALSYYTVFSLAPLLLIVVSVAGLVFGEETVRGRVFGHLTHRLGRAAPGAVTRVPRVGDKPRQRVARLWSQWRVSSAAFCRPSCRMSSWRTRRPPRDPWGRGPACGVESRCASTLDGVMRPVMFQQ